ncbi:SIR2 family protein [uncultured Thiodictyon sp.]|uniref:SIR2 family protein n=1 Tax=uncultured Thiodictyon sp. TaxID=1846217 RepID=UPI0025F99523|nr:SIR2 family protein [uncultured Thiodictyon sp.]
MSDEVRKLKAALLESEVDLVADAIVRSVNGSGRTADLQAFLGSVFDRDGAALPERYRRLAGLRLSAALTTTFDTLLERTFSPLPDSALTPKDTEQLLGALSSKQFFIGKLYGKLCDPDSVMLSPSQYEEEVARNEGFGQFMESLFVSRTLLFLGCSLKGIQDYLGGLRIKGASRRHDALVAVSGEVWETKAAYLLDRYGIQVIPVPEDKAEESVDAFINDLAEAIASRRLQAHGFSSFESAGTLRDGSPGLIREVHLRNIGLFTDLCLELDPQWSVLLGDNGVGKSTVLKAIALAFCGRDGRDYAERLLAAGQTSGQISIRTDRQEYVTNLSRTRSGVEVTSLPDRPLEIESWLALGFPALRTLTWRAARVGSDDEGRGRPVSQDLTPLLSGDPDPRLDEVKDWIVSLDY